MLACKSYSGLEEWGKVENMIDLIPNDHEEKPYYKAVLAIRDNETAKACEFVEESRRRIYN